MYQLPVVLSAFANSPDQAYLGQLKAEHDYLLEVFLKRSDLRHSPLLFSGIEHLLQFIQEYSADLQILHFGGHADGKQLFLEDQAGQGAGLARLLGTCPQLKLVVLNGCNTQAQADVYLAMGIPAVIATTCSVADGQATKFAQFLYRALANHQNIEHAFRQAMGAMEFAGNATSDDGIVVYRGLERPKGDDEAPWKLYIQEERAGEIKTWTFDDPDRLQRLITFYTNLKSLNSNKRLPWGTTFLSHGLTAETTAQQYHDYLSEGVLPYYSLDAFHLEREVSENFFSEVKLIDRLLKDPGLNGGFISGKGGVGKTRLMLQMGILAHEQDWNVMVINSQFSDMAALCEFLDSLRNTQHLLLIDYIEECNWFNEKFVRDIRSNCVHAKDIRFLANCRNSFSPPSGSAFLHISLDDHALRADYEHWVIENIVQEFKAQLKAGARRRFYVKKPSFAVFLRYLQQRHPNKDLLEVGDFKDWLIKRFKHTLNATHKSIKDFGAEIKWLLCLPLTRAEKEEHLRDESKFKSTLEALIKDGWIEESNQGGVNSWRIVQDTVMDELAVAYFEVFSDLKTELLNSFEQALKLGKGKNWMWAIHRIRDTNLLQGKKEVFYEVFRKGLKNENGGDFALAYELGYTALIDENQRFGLIARFPLFFESLIRKVTFALPLSYAMNWYAKQKEEAPANVRVLTKQWLSQWGEGKVVDTALTAKLLSTYVKLYGFDEVVEPLFEQFFRSKVVWEGSYILEAYLESKQPITKKVKKYLKQYLEEFVGQKELHFIITAWLNAGGNSNIIQKSVFNYLNRNVEEKEASFVIKAWLNAGGDKFIIQNGLVNYLNHNAEKKEASFVIQAWLNASGDKSIIQKSVVNYLNHNTEGKEANYIIQAWLKAEGNKTIVQKSVVNYLNHNAEEKEASYIIQSWLKAGGDTTIVQKSVVNYLNHNTEDKEAGFVIQAWLNAGGDKSIIQISLINYIGHNTKEKEASFVIQAWLNTGGDKNIIQNSLINYLNHNAGEKEASFVIQAWLNAGGDKSIIQNSLISYLNHNSKDKEGNFVIQAWLNARGDRSIIENNLINYLNNNAEENEAKFVIQAWLNAGGDKFIIQNGIVNYLNHNAEDKEASFVIQAWLNAGGDKFIIQNGIVNYLNHNAEEKEASFVIQAWLNAGGDKSIIQISLINYLNHNAEDKDARFVIQTWLKTKGDANIIKTALKAFLNKHTKSIQASYIICNWLDATGDTDFISLSVAEFLQETKTEREASFVLSRWMLNKGSKEIIDTHLKHYLINHYKNRFSAYVLGSLLDPIYEEDDSIEYALAYLAINHLCEEAGFVFNGWIANNKPKHLILENLNKYLTMHHSFQYLYRFYQSALINPNYHSIVKPYVADWIKVNANQIESIPVFFEWIKTFQEIENLNEVLNHLLNQLQTIGQLPQFYLALPPSGTPERDILDPYLQAWEKNHS